MNYKKNLGIVIFLIALNSCVGINPNGGYDITVPLSMVNSTVQGNFPQSKKTSYGTLLIEKPNILSRADKDKLGVGTSFKFTNMLIPNGIKGSVNLSSGIRFDPSTKGIYLASPMVDDIKFQNFSLAKYLTKSMRNQIGLIVAQTLAKRPIYSLKGKTGISFVKGLSVKNGSIVVNLGL